MKLMGLTWMCNKCGTVNDVSTKKCINCGLHVDDNALIPFVGYVSTYKTALIISKAVSFIGWVVVILVVILSVFALIRLELNMWSVSVYLIAAGGILSGILLVIAGQFTRATIDTADNTTQILAIMKSK